MQPIPEISDNVNVFNPYAGKDRGLFRTGRDDFKYARLQSAVWTTYGPEAALGMLEFTLAGYVEAPTTEVEYKTYTLLKTKLGESVFNCITRQQCLAPILIESFAIEIWYSHYMTGGEKLSNDEKQKVIDSGKRFTSVLGEPIQIDDVMLVVEFAVGDDASPISRVKNTLTYKGTKAGAIVNRTISVDLDKYDPVLLAGQDLKDN